MFFRSEDYAGVWRRLAAEVIDVTTSFAITVLLLTFILPLTGMAEGDASRPFLTWLLVLYAYFVLFKRSRVGTLGYRIARIRIVNLQGAVPSLFSLSMRLAFGIVTGPFSFLEDLDWMRNDPHRQALRDKFGQTYVVKAGTQPIGRGRIAYPMYCILGYTFLFPEVKVAGRAGG